ncbi:MAG: septation protein IspZ, partial [Pseudomonadota bacterium]
MTDHPTQTAQAADKANQLWADLIPVIAFIGIYNGIRLLGIDIGPVNGDTALYWATGALIVLTFIFIALKVIRSEPVPLFMVFSSVIVGGFGLLGIVLQDKAFIYFKPTIQQLFLAGMIFGSLAIGSNIWKVMFEKVFDLPDHAWRTLAIRWGLYFVAMAAWNEYLWRMYIPGFEAPVTMAGIPIAPAGAYEFLGMTFGA